MTTDTPSAWRAVELARHAERPYAMDYIRRLVPEFIELKGDRLIGDDAALIAGVGRWRGRPTMWFGQQKGRNQHDRLLRHYGMMMPEGYRKASRLARQAAKFNFPIVSLIDTPGAFPGAASEERGIASAIGQVIMDWFEVRVPIVAAVIGEGGSGGALGMAVADRVLILEHGIYSVAAPEAAASIIWRDGAHKTLAAEQLSLTAPDLLEMNVVEEVVPEPGEGAHTDHDAAAAALDVVLGKHMEELLEVDPEDLLRRRYERYRYLDSVLRSYLRQTETLL